MSASNPNSRLEAFCDGVFAIAITLLILDMKVPPLEKVHSTQDLWNNVARLWPSFFALCLSFTIILIGWIGHHNLIRQVDKTSPLFLFANGFFLFTVIFIPFPTAFMAEYLNTDYAQPAIVFYCLNGILHNIGWLGLFYSIFKPKLLLRNEQHYSYIKKSAMQAGYGFFIYVALAVLAWWFPYTALIINVSLWIYWLYVAVSLKEN